MESAGTASYSDKKKQQQQLGACAKGQTVDN